MLLVSVVFFTKKQYISLVVDVDGLTMLKHMQTYHTFGNRNFVPFTQQTSETRTSKVFPNITNNHQIAQFFAAKLPPNHLSLQRSVQQPSDLCLLPEESLAQSLKVFGIRGDTPPHHPKQDTSVPPTKCLCMSLSLYIYICKYVYIYIYVFVLRVGHAMPCSNPHRKTVLSSTDPH